MFSGSWCAWKVEHKVADFSLSRFFSQSTVSEYHPDSPGRKTLNNFLLEVGVSPINKNSYC